MTHSEKRVVHAKLPAEEAAIQIRKRGKRDGRLSGILICLQIIGFVQILFLTCSICRNTQTTYDNLFFFAVVPRQFELEAESLCAAAN